MPSSELVGEQEALQQVARPTAPATAAPNTDVKHPLLGLQRQAGNRSVVEMLGAQAALEVGRADDPREREAESVAERVVAQFRGSRPARRQVSDGPVEGGLARLIRRRGTARREGMGAEGGAVDPGIESEIAAERGRGSPLPATARRDMERAFGADFSRVRVHEGPAASELSRQLGARAFTIGSDIFFSGPTPDTSSTDGQRLLAHELTHTVQQGAAPVGRSIQRDEEESKEAEGEEAASNETAESAESEESKEEEEEGEEGEIAIQGSIDGSEFKETPEEVEGPPSGLEADASIAGRAAPGARAMQSRPTRSNSGKVYRFDISALDLKSSITETSGDALAEEGDTIVAKPKIKTSIKPGGTVTPFGALSRGWDVDSFSYKEKVKDGALAVSAAFALNTQWGTNDGGRKDIKSGNSSEITAETYEDIADDLTPRAVEKSWVAPRTKYWSKAICARHEKFHATDVTGWAKKQGKDFLVDYLGKKSVTLSDEERADKEKVKVKLKPIVEDARDAVQVATTTYMRGVGNTYYSYPGEERAFGDGKQPYIDLMTAVRKRGVELDNKKKKAAAKSGNS